MTPFVLSALLLVLAVCGRLLWAARHGAGDSADRTAQNLRIARERLATLEAMHAAGELDAEALARERAALEDEIALQGLDGSAPAAGPRRGSRWVTAGALAAVPVLAAGLYAALGTPQAIAPAPLADAAGGRAGGAPHDVDDMLARLERRLQANPDDERGWALLARSYLVLGRYDESVRALKRLRSLVGDRADVLVSLADALAMVHGGRLSGEPERLVARALQAEPRHPTALWLAGMAAAEHGDHRQALAYWQRLEPLLGDDAKALAELHGLIDRARGALGLPALERAPAPAPAPSAQAATAAGGTKAIEVRVTLDRALAAGAPADTPVFIYARALKGPPMPLAVVRRRLADLPLTVRLDDSLAMMPRLRLSAFSQVKVGARVALSGQPTAQPGDLQGEVAPVAPGGEPVAIVIDQRVP